MGTKQAKPTLAAPLQTESSSINTTQAKDNITIFIGSYGEKPSLTVNKTMKISELFKLAAREIDSFHADGFLYSGKKLIYRKKISDYKIKNGDTIEPIATFGN